MKSCADLDYSSFKMRGKITLDVSLDVVPNCNKNHQVALPFPNTRISSQPFPRPKELFAKQLDFSAPEGRMITEAQAGAIPGPC